jgi:outer membrane murein-binding lipoprotein Lpp
MNPGPSVQTMSAEATEIATLKSDVAKLTQQVGALQSQLSALQTNVQAFHTEFDKHTHSFGPSGLGIMTVLNCPGGYGQPCTSATSLKEITVFTPETGIPGLTSSPVH